MSATVKQLAALVRGRLIGDGTRTIHAAKAVTEAGPGSITFLNDDRYAKSLRVSGAEAVLHGPHFRIGDDVPESMTRIEVDDPLDAFVQVKQHLSGQSTDASTGVHPRAYVAESAQLGEQVTVHPLAYVGDGAVLGSRTVVGPGAVVEAHCRVGDDCRIHANATICREVVLGDRVEVHPGAVIGADGFGYRQVDGRHAKVPQLGTVEVGNDVEVGANSTVDRGTFEPTRIGDGTKIDNLVMIGHNNQIGQHVLICGQVGIAGSCRIGDAVVLAGQAGIKDHVEIGTHAIVGAQAGVHHNVEASQQVLGSPAIPVKDQRRIFAMVARLPEMHRRIKQLSKQNGGTSDIDSSGQAIPQDDPTGF